MSEPVIDLPELHDPTDDLDEPALVLPPEESEPVPLEEVPDSEALAPPEGWGDGLTDDDVAERLAGVEITEDPEDGAGH
jgi:hypothetical protein